jgi:hypothetical protein
MQQKAGHSSDGLAFLVRPCYVALSHVFILHWAVSDEVIPRATKQDLPYHALAQSRTIILFKYSFLFVPLCHFS